MPTLDSIAQPHTSCSSVVSQGPRQKTSPEPGKGTFSTGIGEPPSTAVSRGARGERNYNADVFVDATGKSNISSVTPLCFA